MAAITCAVSRSVGDAPASHEQTARDFLVGQRFVGATAVEVPSLPANLVWIGLPVIRCIRLRHVGRIIGSQITSRAFRRPKVCRK